MIDALIAELRSTQKFFKKSAACLEEKDSTFAPVEGLMTSAQHVAHVALTVDWFVEGAFRPEGFDMDFEQHIDQSMQFDSLEKALEAVDKAFDSAVEVLSSKSVEELSVPLPEGPVMGGAPRFAIVSGITDHSAHHRGALTVYSRLCGHTPEMPY